MLKVSPDQRAVLSQEMDAKRILRLADTIHSALRTQAPDVMAPYSEEESSIAVLDTLTKCDAHGIRNEDQLLNLCYIRFIINADVFTNDSFSYILNNGFMHPYAKARHLILSFFAINAMRAGG